MPTEMQRYKVDFHKLIYGAVKPAEGKKAQYAEQIVFSPRLPNGRRDPSNEKQVKLPSWHRPS
jgi:hypothetical protein